ncbi:MAG TPA: ADOP family duplicated permease [Vicinamibacterales bacterium]|jgi:predicted permease
MFPLVRQAWRSWRGATGVAFLAAAALAAGIGAATAIYTVVDAVMLKPLPYRDGDRFVALFSAETNDPEHYGSLRSPDARVYQERATSFDAFGWFRESSKNLTFAGEPHHVKGVAVTTNLVQQLGVDPMLGQWFHDDSGVVISNGLWRELGSDPRIVGKPLTLDGRRYTVSGVTSERFHLPVAGITSAGQRTDMWFALDTRENAGSAYFAYARRRPGVSFSQADADVKRIASQIATDDPVGHRGYTARLFDLRETVIKDIRPTLMLLVAAAGLLFLITCANAAGLLLARSVARARETAVRVAVGARRAQLAVVFFAESLPVAFAGALGGFILSLTLTPAIVTMAADYLPRADEVSVDWSVLIFLLAAALLATVLSALAPLWQAMRTAPTEALGDGARASAGARSRRISQSLVVAEIALAFGLLAASAQLIIHLRGLSRTAAGFDADNLLTFGLSVPGDHSRRVPFQRRVADALRGIPGTSDVAFTSHLPLDGCCFGTSIYPAGRAVSDTESTRTSIVAVSPEFFRVFRIPVRRGRLLTDQDLNDKQIFAVINESAARRYWRDQNPVGARGRFGGPQGAPLEVVGVVGDVKNDGLANPTVPEVYILSPIREEETVEYAVRSATPPAALVPEIRRVIRAIDPEQPIHDLRTMREIVAESMTLERAGAFLTTFFAAAALLLAALGIYGVISYSVRQRTAEIGTRMAIGATARDIVALILGGGGKMAAYGVLLGGIAAVGGLIVLSRALGINELGPTPFLYSTAIVGTVALVGSALPAWRASLVSPMVAIRGETSSILREAGKQVGRTVRELSQTTAAAIVPLGTLISEFAASLRQVSSVSDATKTALTAMKDRVHATSVMLLEKTSAIEYRDGRLSIPANGILLERLKHYPHPLALTEGDFDAWRRWTRELKPQHTAEIERLAESGARLAVPLRTKNEIVGVMLLGAPIGRAGYTDQEKELLSHAGDVFALMLENGRLTDRAVEQEKLRRDLALAAEVQRRLLPPEPPRSETVTLTAFTLPARSVGGDYYDFIDLGGGGIGVAIADVSGKGVAAALVMSVVQASLRVISSDQSVTVSQLAARMNGFLHQSTGANKYATFFYAQITEGGRRLRYVNAGHNPPYLVRRSRAGVEIAELTVGGTVLGLFPAVTFEEATIDLCPGDILVAFTDGVTEAMNAAGDEFGEDRLKELLRSNADAFPAEIASRLSNHVRDWIGDAEQHDDLTFVVVAVNPRAL